MAGSGGMRDHAVHGCDYASHHPIAFAQFAVLQHLREHPKFVQNTASSAILSSFLAIQRNVAEGSVVKDRVHPSPIPQRHSHVVVLRLTCADLASSVKTYRGWSELEGPWSAHSTRRLNLNIRRAVKVG